MNEETKKKSILKFELFNDGTSTTEQDLLGLLAYVQKVAAEGGKTVDVIADVVCKVVASVQKKADETQKEVDKINQDARNRRDKDQIEKILAEKTKLADKAEELVHELCKAEDKIEDLEAKLKSAESKKASKE